jgi:DNA helicase IV
VGLKEELAVEQEFVDAVYRRIEALRERSAELAAEVVAQGRGGLVSDRVERDARVEWAARRNALLSIGDLPVCFGRLDMDAGEHWHVGRLGVSDEDGEVLLMDWRAPLAEAFYRATSQDRRHVRSRRHIRMRGRKVTGLDDEPLVGPKRSDRSRLVGEGALLAALSSPRTGHMGDIVATIQSAQDAAIRAPMHGPLVIDGGPGTGKTAVALHRAAFLLYEHRFPLAEQGVLVVGPNPTFCRYVEQVLPGLGETGVRLESPGDLVPSRSSEVADAPDVAAVKASDDMAGRLAETVRSHQLPLEETAYVGLGTHRLPVTPSDSTKMIEAARRAGTHNRGRVVLERRLLRYLLRRAQLANERSLRTGMIATRQRLPSDTSTVDALRRSEEVRQLAERLWPALSADQVVDETLAAVGVPRSGEAYSEHDLALLDEAESLLGAPIPPRRPSRRSGSVEADATLDRTLSDMGIIPSCPRCGQEVELAGRRWACQTCQQSWPLSRLVPPEQAQQVHEIIERVEVTHGRPMAEAPRETFGHVIVDEAQDLSPMQWRMLARRCPTGSFTIVGDLGQSKHPWCPEGWDQVCSLAAPDHPGRVETLTVNYRTPAEVMGVAAAVLARYRPDLAPPTAVRSTGVPPRIVPTAPGERAATTARALAGEEAVTVSPGKVGVIWAGAPDDRSSPARRGPTSSPMALDQPVVELTITEAKGLEFDSVVIVEPADFSGAELYVAMTRTTSRLALVHEKALPPGIPADMCTTEPQPSPAGRARK